MVYVLNFSFLFHPGHSYSLFFGFVYIVKVHNSSLSMKPSALVKRNLFSLKFDMLLLFVRKDSLFQFLVFVVAVFGCCVAVAVVVGISESPYL